jgi:hypothetical protein
MAAETVAWFLFGGEREDWLFDPGMSPWPSAMFWLRFAVLEWQLGYKHTKAEKVVDSHKVHC